MQTIPRCSLAFPAFALLLFSACAREPWHEIPVVELTSPAAPGAMLPHLAALSSDGLVLSWVEPARDGHALKVSTFRRGAWDANSRVVAQGGDWFVNWADFPSVVPIDATHWSAHWLVKRPGGDYAYDIALSVSVDGGATWKPAVTPHLDGIPAEHGFVSRFPVDGGFAAVWLDGREMSGAGDHSAHGATGAGAMTLRAARVGLDGQLGEQFLVDPRVCDCCQTAATMTKRGALVAYRDRSEQEVRDISVARFEGGAWQNVAGPKADGWTISGCPVNGPAIDAADDNVALAWFTAAEGRPRVRLALSRNAGDDFGNPILIEEGVLGRVDVVALDDGGAVVSWLAQTGEGAEIRLRRVAANGEMSPIRTVAATQPARSSGFPQLARSGDDLVLAWTVVGEPSSVHVAMLKGAAR